MSSKSWPVKSTWRWSASYAQTPTSQSLCEASRTPLARQQSERFGGRPVRYGSGSLGKRLGISAGSQGHSRKSINAARNQYSAWVDRCAVSLLFCYQSLNFDSGSEVILDLLLLRLMPAAHQHINRGDRGLLPLDPREQKRRHLMPQRFSCFRLVLGHPDRLAPFAVVRKPSSPERRIGLNLHTCHVEAVMVPTKRPAVNYSGHLPTLELQRSTRPLGAPGSTGLVPFLPLSSVPPSERAHAGPVESCPCPCRTLTLLQRPMRLSSSGADVKSRPDSGCRNVHKIDTDPGRWNVGFLA